MRAYRTFWGTATLARRFGGPVHRGRRFARYVAGEEAYTRPRMRAMPYRTFWGTATLVRRFGGPRYTAARSLRAHQCENVTLLRCFARPKVHVHPGVHMLHLGPVCRAAESAHGARQLIRALLGDLHMERLGS